MSQITSIVIHDTTTNILSKDTNTKLFDVHPFAEGQTFFAIDTRKFFKDKNGQRTIQIQFESIEAYDGTIEEFYERGTEGFEGEILVARAPGGYRMYYVDTEGKLNSLSYSPQEVLGIAQSSGLPEGFSNITLNFYKLTDVDTSQISNLTPPTVSGSINFETGAITFDSISDPWVSSIAELDGEWTYDDENEKWLFDEDDLPEQLDPQKVKIVFSQIFLFSESAIYEFEDRVGDVPSKWREDGTNQVTLFLYRATEEETAPTARPGDLVYDFESRELSGNFNGWLEIAPTTSSTNKFIWAIAATAASNITLALIPSDTWDGAKVVANYSVGEAGGTGPQGPTTVFKGDWSSSATYINKDGQRDIVYLPSVDNYFILTGAQTSTNQNPSNGNPWTSFNFFQFIATEISLTKESIVRENITVGGNQEIIISGKDTNNPYISIGQGTIGYDNEGIYMDRDSSNSRLSIKGSGTNSLTWNGSSLSIVGSIGGSISEVKIGSNIVLNGETAASPYISIGQGTVGYDNEGIYIDRTSDGESRLSLKGSGTNALTWNGSSLDVIGDIGGTIGEIRVGSPDTGAGIKFSSSGFEAFDSSGTRTVNIAASGTASFTGTIDAGGGDIGGWTIEEDSLSGGAFTSVSPNGFLINNTTTQANSIMSGNYIKTGRNTDIILNELIDSDVDATAGASSPVSTLGGLVITGRSSLTSDDSLIASVRSLRIDTRLNNTDITINAARNILLNGQGGGIYATSSIDEASPVTNEQNLVLTKGGTLNRFTPSSRLIKENIKEVNKEELFEFLTNVSVKGFNFIEKPDLKGYSIIIEDEKETPLIKDLIRQQPKTTIYNSFEDVPKYLKKHIGTEILKEEDGVIYYSPWMIDSTSVSFLSLAILKEHNKDIINLNKAQEKLFLKTNDLSGSIVNFKEEINQLKIESNQKYESISNFVEELIDNQKKSQNIKVNKVKVLEEEVKELKETISQLKSALNEVYRVLNGAKKWET